MRRYSMRSLAMTFALAGGYVATAQDKPAAPPAPPPLPLLRRKLPHLLRQLSKRLRLLPLHQLQQVLLLDSKRRRHLLAQLPLPVWVMVAPPNHQLSLLLTQELHSVLIIAAHRPALSTVRQFIAVATTQVQSMQVLA